MKINCDRRKADTLTVDLDNPKEVFINCADEHGAGSVLFTDRAKVERLRDALTEWLEQIE